MHIFSGIVYSQCLRLRRIINNGDRLKNRLNELCSAFEKSEYPSKMLIKISTKVLGMERQLERAPLIEEEGSADKPILVVSCHGTVEKLVKSIMDNEEDLLKTESFKKLSKPVFHFVKKTGSNIGCKLSILKSIALGKKRGPTLPCNNHSNCMCCKLIGGENIEEVNGLPISCAPGNCKSKNVIYLVTCRICHKPYFGRTVQLIHNRMSGHRECYYIILDGKNIDDLSDDFSLGLHLVQEHGCVDREDFNNLLAVQIVENCSPSLLEKKEHLYIHKFKTLTPFGLNKVNPFGLSLLSS